MSVIFENWKANLKNTHTHTYTLTNVPTSPHTDQQWTKKILKEFRERHPDAPKRAGGSATSTPRKQGSKKRVKREQDPEDEEDELEHKFDSNEDNNDYALLTPTNGGDDTVKSEIACKRTPRRAAPHKKVKYEETSDNGGNIEDHENFEGHPGDEECGKRHIASGKRSRAMYMKEEDEDDEFTV